jgi:hypothetical protein
MSYRLGASAIICFVAILLLGADVSLASEASNKQTHNWAISFAIGGDFTLAPHEGSGVSIVRRLSERYCLRLSEGMNFQHLKVTGKAVGKTLDFENAVSLVCLGYINQYNRARFYWGAGPQLYYNYSKDESDLRTRATKSWGVGLIGLLGIEVFATDYLSLHAEYRSVAGYMRRSSPFDVAEWYNADIGDDVILGVSLHF